MGSARRRRAILAVLLLAVLLFLTGGMTGHGDSRTLPVDPPHGDGCTQSRFALHESHQLHTFTWVLDVSSIPSYLDRGQAVAAIRRATDTMDRARTACPQGQRLSPDLPRAIYDGPTTLQANITPDALCFPPGNSDGINVVSFGRLPDDVLAVTCTYSDRGDIWQSDVMLNDTPGLFTLDPFHGCVDRYDLQAVVTHERGHSFGLAHVPESSGSDQLTMSSIIGRCDASARTLGWGDVLGLRVLYPPDPFVPSGRDRRP